MVTQNSENGAEDPQYPWARDLARNGAQVRYCEVDGTDFCHLHTAEDVAWFVIDRVGFTAELPPIPLTNS